MKILVLGANGMAGHTIAIYFNEAGHLVTGYSIVPIDYCEYIIGNAFDTDNLRNILLSNEYDVIINCIGILNADADNNPSKAIYLNSYLPHLVADFLKDSKTKFIHMSTDCVFAGNTGPYLEDTFKDGRTFYDRSKALGEVIDNKNLTFRNSIIGPDINPGGIGLFNWFMKQSGQIKGYSGAIWTGVTTLTLAKAMEKAVSENISGLYNLVNNNSISKLELLKLFNKHFMHDAINIQESTEVNIDKSLKNSRTDFDFIVPDYETMIIEMKEWILNHRNLYPHYSIL